MESRYEACTQMLALKLRCSAGPILASATATMLPSSGAMKAPTLVRARSSQRRSWSWSTVMRRSVGIALRSLPRRGAAG